VKFVTVLHTGPQITITNNMVKFGLFVIGWSPITLERQKRKSSTININPVEFEENRSSLMQSALESHIFNPHAIFIRITHFDPNFWKNPVIFINFVRTLAFGFLRLNIPVHFPIAGFCNNKISIHDFFIWKKHPF